MFYETQKPAAPGSLSGESQAHDPAQKPAASVSVSDEQPAESRAREKELFRISHLKKSYGDVTPVRDIAYASAQGKGIVEGRLS